MVGARHSWIVGYDNVSFVSPEVSDAMCRLSSGGSMTKRALYTDGDEFSMLACRPILLNGIPDKLASRPDLIDRMILIKAPPITSTKRKTEEEFWREFKAAHTYILGALLEGVAAALSQCSQDRHEGGEASAVRFCRSGLRLDVRRWASRRERLSRHI